MEYIKKDLMAQFARKSKAGKKYYQFNSFGSLVDFCEENKNFIYSQSLEATERSYGFAGTATWDEAVELARFGWKDGVEKINNKISVKNQGIEFKREYRIAGGNVCVPRYLQGMPNNMIGKKAVEKKDKVITLVKFSAILGSVSSNKYIENGVKFIQLVQKLESQGYRCNVDLLFGSDCLSLQHVVRVRIKNANERLNVAKMSFPMAHTSMFRRFIFKTRELSVECKNHIGSSFYRDGYDRRGAEKTKPYLNDNDYLVPFIIENVEDFKLEKVA